VLSPDGQRIAVGTTLGGVSIHAAGAPGGILLGTAEALPGTAQSEIISLAFSRDRQMLAGASIDGRVRVWNAFNGEAREIAIVHPDGGAHDMEFIDAGQRFISASRREVIVTDLVSGEALARLRIQANHPQLALAPDSSDVYIADDQNGVTVWNWRSGQSEQVVPGSYAIRTVAVTADGRKLVTASDQRELLLWDLETGQPLEQSVQLAGKVDDMWMTGSNRLLVQAGYWLQLVGISPNGLSIRSTRLLPDAPASVRPGTRPDTAFVLSSSPARPLLREVQLNLPPETELAGDPAEQRNYWQRRLSLEIDENGDFRPLAGGSMLISGSAVEASYPEAAAVP
jgi:WD40 repeat protein